MAKPILYWRFVRPFTLLLPALGMVSGALMALGAKPQWESKWSDGSFEITAAILLGGLMAAALNGYSNGINQIFDIEVDRINKPHRPLPSGTMSVGEAWGVTLACIAVALVLSGWINQQCLALVLLAAFLTTIYSAPPLRTKSRGAWANLTIAIPRGTLLMVAGWSTVKDIFQLEPWIVGGVLGLFFMGAATTKDFSDIEGDRKGGCRTLPVIYGVHRATQLIAPFFVIPFLVLLGSLFLGYLSGHPIVLGGLGFLLTVWGGYIAYLLLRSGQELAANEGGADFENHPSWKHMYLLTLVAQVGLALAYLISE